VGGNKWPTLAVPFPQPTITFQVNTIMGWTGLQLGQWGEVSTREEYIRKTWEPTYDILELKKVGSTFYLLVQDKKVGDVTLGVVLTQKHGTETCFKEMSETCGPCECAVPLAWLDRCTAPDPNGYGAEYRERVRGYWAQQKAAKAKAKGKRKFGFFALANPMVVRMDGNKETYNIVYISESEANFNGKPVIFPVRARSLQDTEGFEHLYHLNPSEPESYLKADLHFPVRYTARFANRFGAEPLDLVKMAERRALPTDIGFN
jgi:hypothetical protein